MPTEINGTEVHGGMAVVLAMLANLVNLPAISVPAGLTAFTKVRNSADIAASRRVLFLNHLGC